MKMVCIVAARLPPFLCFPTMLPSPKKASILLDINMESCRTLMRNEAERLNILRACLSSAGPGLLKPLPLSSIYAHQQPADVQYPSPTSGGSHSTGRKDPDNDQVLSAHCISDMHFVMLNAISDEDEESRSRYNEVANSLSCMLFVAFDISASTILDVQLFPTSPLSSPTFSHSEVQDSALKFAAKLHLSPSSIRKTRAKERAGGSEGDGSSTVVPSLSSEAGQREGFLFAMVKVNATVKRLTEMSVEGVEELISCEREEQTRVERVSDPQLVDRKFTSNFSVEEDVSQRQYEDGSFLTRSKKNDGPALELRVLIVDDDIMNEKILSRVVQKAVKEINDENSVLASAGGAAVPQVQLVLQTAQTGLGALASVLRDVCYNSDEKALTTAPTLTFAHNTVSEEEVIDALEKVLPDKLKTNLRKDFSSLMSCLKRDKEMVSGSGREQGGAAVWKGANAIFSDIQMPGSVDGLMLSRILRRMGLLCPIMATSARGDAIMRDECEKAGMDGLLVKPVSKSALKEAIMRVLPDA
eukprot:CAMPEP_0113872040 /NCGR_PEP_ID=MMETSP0780_2-20120614/2979_1 /TAXON_ID=652834 /ORGANISM="Palpitomonas bilix" /LENGTH=527 /DNA_ID=CAMNT_0000857501 /DNA_START=10 /DNA_END=1593 /DNA_ORIENTATION=- /assembly_acc=CAM_ASM_000599